MSISTVHTSVTKPSAISVKIGVFVAAFIAGTVVGLACAGAEVFNQAGAQAEAQALMWEAEAKAAREQIDLEHYAIERAVKSEEHVKQLRQQTLAQRRRDEARMQLVPILYWAGGIAIISIGFGITYYLLAQAPDPVEIAKLREQAKTLAKANEKLVRALMLQARQQQFDADSKGHLRHIEFSTT
jgi:hypothetical protein